jgi:hypothetical protein
MSLMIRISFTMAEATQSTITNVRRFRRTRRIQLGIRRFRRSRRFRCPASGGSRDLLSKSASGASLTAPLP